MNISRFVTLASLLMLTACNTGTSISEQNQNPLVASRYGDELADRLADLIIQKDRVLEQAGMEKYVKEKIAEGKRVSQEAHDKKQQGMMGAIIPMNETVTGLALYLDDSLYLSSDFTSDPGPSLHVYLTTVVDPRDAPFPDATAIDLGEIKNFYGASTYAVPHQAKPELLRTIVFYDTKLNRLYAFGQLSRQQP